MGGTQVRELPISMMSLWSWVQALTEAKEKGKGHAITVLVSGRPLSGWDPVGGALTINLALIPTLSHPTFIGCDRR